MKPWWQYLLYPFTPLYWLGVTVRNVFFDVGILRSRKFPIWVISVGNLSAGGTGKSPHIEYLIRILGTLSLNKKNMDITPSRTAVLSRGYGRNTTGFVLASETSTAHDIGDEPMQMKQKFKDLYIAVDEKRPRGIDKLLEVNKEINLVLLDDAFQHRYVSPAMSILLTNYHQPFYEDNLMPVGTLREPAHNYKRSDIIIVTRSPHNITDVERKMMTKKIKPLANQKVFYSSVVYEDIVPVYKNNTSIPVIGKNTSVVLFTGIANANDLKKNLQSKAKEVKHLEYPDHHWYSLVEIMKVVDTFKQIQGEDKIIITTEKDAARLHQASVVEQLGNLPLFYMPIHIVIKEEKEFQEELLRQLGSYQLYNPIQKIR